MQGKDIIVISMQPWDHHIGSNAKNIAQQFSKRNRVLYVNEPLDRVTLIRSNKRENWLKKRIDVIKGRSKGLIKIEENLWNLYPNFLAESINWIPFKFIYNIVNRFNNKQLSKSILNACKELGFNDYVLFNDNLMFKGLFLNEFLRPAVSVYYLRDFLIVQSYFKKHGPRIEAEIIKRYDLILTNSMYLNDYASQFNSNSFYVGQGCDLEIYNPESTLQVPIDIQTIKKPIIGYTGFLTSMRLNISLIEFIATKHPEWSIVLIGPEDKVFKESNLHGVKNVFFLGTKDQNELPSFVKQFDVCINPQVVNQLTIGNYPRKIDEYLALGKPVVATHTKTMESFSDVVSLSKNKEDFVFCIEEALESNNMKKENERILFANTHSWENSVSKIYDVFKSYNNLSKKLNIFENNR
jgi:teichuronic acid biosynthesis glycosyltransferase TuaH